MAHRNNIEEYRADLQKARRQRVNGAGKLKRLADLLAPVLSSAPPDLQVRLDSLWDYARRSKHPLAAVFAVRRYSSKPILSELWWLQVLVMVAQDHGSRRRWIVPRNLDAGAQKVNSAIKAAGDAWDRHVRDRGSAVVDDLIDAIELLLDYVPRGLTLDGMHLVRDGVCIIQKLTPKEALFVRLLIDANGKTVSHSEFQNQGIGRNDLLKTRFLRKPEFTFLEDHIVSDSGRGYRLIN